MRIKENGSAARRPVEYHAIHMPSNTPAGFVIGVLAFFAGFGLIWHIWWLAAIGTLGILVTLIARASHDNTGYFIPAEAVQATEERRSRASGGADRTGLNVFKLTGHAATMQQGQS